MKGYRVWALLSVFIQVVSIVALKYAAIACGDYFCWSLANYYGAVVCLLFLRVVFWNLALSRGNLSDVYVFTVLNPVFLLCLSSIVLNENVSITSAFGAGVVVFAIFMQQRRAPTVS